MLTNKLLKKRLADLRNPDVIPSPERWKTIPSYPAYEISNYGSVRDIEFKMTRGFPSYMHRTSMPYILDFKNSQGEIHWERVEDLYEEVWGE